MSTTVRAAAACRVQGELSDRLPIQDLYLLSLLGLHRTTDDLLSDIPV